MINTENERLLTANQNQHHLNTNQNDNENDSLVSSSDNGSDTSKQNTTKKGSKYQKKEDEIIFGGRFECNRNLLLGSGTFGEIYFGIDTLQKEYVAVKLEKPTAKEKGIIMKNLMPLTKGKADGKVDEKSRDFAHCQEQDDHGVHAAER